MYILRSLETAGLCRLASGAINVMCPDTVASIPSSLLTKELLQTNFTAHWFATHGRVLLQFALGFLYMTIGMAGLCVCRRGFGRLSADTGGVGQGDHELAVEDSRVLGGGARSLAEDENAIDSLPALFDEGYNDIWIIDFDAAIFHFDQRCVKILQTSPIEHNSGISILAVRSRPKLAYEKRAFDVFLLPYGLWYRFELVDDSVWCDGKDARDVWVVALHDGEIQLFRGALGWRRLHGQI